MEWYIKVLKNYANFEGRARPKEFWMFTLFQFLILLGLIVFAGLAAQIVPELGLLGALVYLAYGLGTLIPNIAVAVRRFHDTNTTGWMWLVNFIPFIGFFIYLYFMIKSGDRGPNDYGPDPVRGGSVRRRRQIEEYDEEDDLDFDSPQPPPRPRQRRPEY